MTWKFWKKNKPGTDLIVLPDTKGDWDSCMPGMTVIPEPLQPKEWHPNDFAVKLVIAGNLYDIRAMSRSVMSVQTGLQKTFAKEFPDTKILFSIGTFLDGCRHDTAWSANPADIGSTSTRWHCYPSNTRFNESLNDLRLESQAANIVLLVGERLDDTLETVMDTAKKLFQERGTRVFCIAGKEGNLSEDHIKIAESGGGICLPRLNERGQDIDQEMLVREITQDIFMKLSGKPPELLPALENSDARKIRGLLQDLKIK